MKRTRVFSMLLAFSLVLGSLAFSQAPKAEAAETPTGYTSTAPELTTKADFNYRVSNERIYIDEYIGTKTQIILPDTIDGKPVFAISTKAFSGSDLTYVKLPASVNVIGSNAFNEADSVTAIDVDAANTKFCSIDGVVYTKDKTVLRVFPAGRGGSFTIPDGVTTIHNYAFYRCYQLESVNMYNTVTEIGERAFSFCWNLKSIRLSDKLEKINTFAFSHCDDLTSIYLPKSIKSIEADAFLGKINSNNSSKEYYFVDGIFCVKGSYAAKYIKSLGLNYISDGNRITDVDSGITVTDLKNVIPADATLKVVPGLLSTIPDDFSKYKYSKAFVFDVYLSQANGNIDVPTGEFLINFDGIDKDIIPSASRVFSSRVGVVERIFFSLTQNSVTCETDALGTFVVLSSNDFSKKGDVDGDGVLTLTDARLTLIASAGIIPLTPAQKKACDVITTGADYNVITANDARKILRTSAGLEKF